MSEECKWFCSAVLGCFLFGTLGYIIGKQTADRWYAKYPYRAYSTEATSSPALGPTKPHIMQDKDSIIYGTPTVSFYGWKIGPNVTVDFNKKQIRAWDALEWCRHQKEVCIGGGKP
jgi:hypothetical protein